MNETNTGEAEGTNKVANVKVTFTGCACLSSLPCTAPAAEGEVKTNTLKGKLGYINKAAKEVGVLLEPAAANKGRFAEFECGEFGIDIVGVGNNKEGTGYTQRAVTEQCPGTTPKKKSTADMTGSSRRSRRSTK